MPVNAERKEVRRKLQHMAPSVAIPYIKSFELPEEEEVVVIRHNCRRESLQQIARSLNMSIEVVKQRHISALEKIAGAK